MIDNGAHLIERAQMLHGQKRYDLAITDLRRALVVDPDNFLVHSLLASSLCEVNQPKDALAEAGEGVRLGPEQGFAYRIYAYVLLRQNRAREAETAIAAAVRLDPFDAENYRIQAYVRLELANWNGVLESTDRGLELQADNVGLINARGRALVKLGRSAEALDAADVALRIAPDNAFSHASKGWSLLESKQTMAALEHFREALRIDPSLEWARSGMVVALKAQYPLYRGILAYYFWMSRLPRQARYGVIAGFWVVNQILHAIGRDNPALMPFIFPLTVAYSLFCYATWTSDPLFNTLLRFNPFGKYLLTRTQIITSNLVASTFVGAVGSFVLWVAGLGGNWLFLSGNLLFFSAVCAGTAKWRANLPDRIRPIVEVLAPVVIVALLLLLSFSGA